MHIHFEVNRKKEQKEPTQFEMKIRNQHKKKMSIIGTGRFKQLES